jgi:hypothetical protein
VGLSSDGFEKQLSALFTAIIASNANQGTGSSPKAGKRILREVNNLFCSITMIHIAAVLYVAGKRLGPKQIFMKPKRLSWNVRGLNEVDKG